MLHLIMFSTLFGSSIALPRPPAGVIGNLVGDVGQAFPEGAVANAIPEDIISNNIRPFMGFDDAMSAKDAFGWTDDQLVLQFSRQEPERVKSFIFRELDNLEIDDATRLGHLETLLEEYPGLKFQPFEMFRVGRTGHGALVTRLLVRQPELGLAAVHASISGNQLQVFRIAIGLETSPDRMMAMMKLAAQHSIPFVESGLHRMSTLPTQMSQMFPRTWYNDLVTHFVEDSDTMIQLQLGNSRHPGILQYLLSRPEWNPGSMDNLLRMMWGIPNSRFPSRLRLGREFLNPRLTFQTADGAQISGGVDALDAAIRQSAQGRGFDWFSLEQTLRTVRDNFV